MADCYCALVRNAECESDYTLDTLDRLQLGHEPSAPWPVVEGEVLSRRSLAREFC
jgi:hypothetical protein